MFDASNVRARLTAIDGWMHCGSVACHGQGRIPLSRRLHATRTGRGPCISSPIVPLARKPNGRDWVVYMEPVKAGRKGYHAVAKGRPDHARSNHSRNAPRDHRSDVVPRLRSQRVVSIRRSISGAKRAQRGGPRFGARPSCCPHDPGRGLQSDRRSRARHARRIASALGRQSRLVISGRTNPV